MTKEVSTLSITIYLLEREPLSQTHMGLELVPDMKIVSENIFIKTKGNALTSEDFADFVRKNEICEFYIAGADAIACVKSTCYNMAKMGYIVHVLSDCITSYDKRKNRRVLQYYESKGCIVEKLTKLCKATTIMRRQILIGRVVSKASRASRR